MLELPNESIYTITKLCKQMMWYNYTYTCIKLIFATVHASYILNLKVTD